MSEFVSAPDVVETVEVFSIAKNRAKGRDSKFYRIVVVRERDHTQVQLQKKTRVGWEPEKLILDGEDKRVFVSG